ncbi:MAG TPA: hypothetical protein VFM04_05435 [Candidatus Methylomirabilis sp.]|nr:hypothetical protein [Candidatus Methylomirabilis sp.]
MLYRLMTRGEREIAPALGGGDLTIARIESGAPRTARMRLGAVLVRLSGTVRICDPYYGVRTLDSLDHIPASCLVRFLTARTNEAGPKLQGALNDFKKERPNIEFRTAAKPGELHDRYVLTSSGLLIVGHGLKDIGGKESFMVEIKRDLAKDLVRQMREAFDARWKSATPI